ncbi:MAG: hypothetical protein ABSC18_04600 [Verrucomicrobiota bacterium]
MRERPMSVTILGMLNIGLGLLGLAGMLLSTMFEGLGAPAAGPSFNSVLAFMDTLYHNPVYMIWNRITFPLNAAASLLLVAAGVGLLLLKNWARLASIGCGIYKIAFAMLNLAVLCLALREILAKALQGAGAVVLVILGLAGFVGAILTLAYPVLLIWFLTRPKAVLAFQP